MPQLRRSFILQAAMIVNVRSMNKPKNIASVVCLFVALGLSTTLIGATAHAAEPAKPTPKLTGEYLVWMKGFSGSAPSTAQFHLTIKRSNGAAFIGTQRWRECTEILERCRSEGATGADWTAAEPVVLVRSAPNTYVLRSRSSQGEITLGKNGLSKAYVLGDSLGKVSRNENGGSSQVYSNEFPPPPTPPPSPEPEPKPTKLKSPS